ncbi:MULTISPECIES: hypothetical protein [Tetragenococcus]|uniref:Uncharacterized protein n=2 Tax=Tetragenococcus TaxID=51668 RepID=A0A091C1E3_9ENTE|nr:MULTISPECIES: hypothetical protein [Tetragenococcus]GMA46922.1 hypothetical protein GCM10025854_11720 [Tetragenococcus muriaticus]KFN90530.1 hypothetical protein TMU3MR103_1443 [Tetragenococcus muriaticus 3MR10-3]BAK94964.1 hypothetical protein TEH_16370 [Tetragenococcus halophilus NBRC 12172]GBD71345.1 putative uncharacterized protein [Tetragenococcus halophilus subsp. halophilus]GMG69049.1 hypothetical protein TEHMS4_19850 [Tetragenococcus halophilus]
MNQVEAIQVGERYKVQPSYFHRPFIGRVNDVSGSTIVFEVENFELCDQEKIEASRLITVEFADVKHSMINNYFFS